MSLNIKPFINFQTKQYEFVLGKYLDNLTLPRKRILLRRFSRNDFGLVVFDVGFDVG